MRYKKLTGVILKKQNYKEADQILTIWTREAGKIRCLAKGVRLAKSKLVYSLQDLSLVEIEVTGKNLPTLISATVAEQFMVLQQDLRKMGAAFYASELLLKITADEQANPQVFAFLVEFLQQLNLDFLELDHNKLVDEFTLNLTQALGFGTLEQNSSHKDIKNFIQDLIEREIKSEAFYQLSSII